MYTTFTISNTETYSEADVKAVMKSAYEDIIGFANRGIVTYSSAKKWIEDLIYIMSNKALKSFEIQLYNSSNERFKSYKYEVSEDGYFTTNSSSGGIDYFDLPKNTKAGLFADWNSDCEKWDEVYKELTENRNWGTNGSGMEGSNSREKSYVSGNLAIHRSVIIKK